MRQTTSILSNTEAGETAAGERDALSTPLALRWDVTALALIVLVAAVLRFWDLGSRAFHHDESLHAVYSWYLYTGKGYLHDPLMHGPFQFHGAALMYFLFGASDYTARILPALLGTATVALPWLLRDRLGTLGALASSALLAVSPSFLYYHRFLREDTYVALWNLLLAVALWGHHRTQRAGFLILGAVALSLAFATKETTYLTVIIFGSYLFLTTFKEIWWSVRRRFSFRDASPGLAFLLMLGTFTLPLGAAGAVIIWNLFGFDPAALGSTGPGVALAGLLRVWATGPAADPAASAGLAGKVLAAFPVLAALWGIAAIIGWRWNWRLWLTCTVAFLSIFALLFTTFFTNMSGLGSGFWGALEYWIAQHDVQRGNQPLFYYLVLIPNYEFLAIALSLVGTVYFGIKQRLRDPFVRFLLWWFLLALPLYSYAGEKMPWLSLHISMPLVLLAGKTMGALAPSIPWKRLWNGGGVLLAGLAFLLLLMLRSLAGLGDSVDAAAAQDIRQPLQVLALLIAAAAAIGGIGRCARRLGLRVTGVSLGLAAVLLLAIFTLRTSFQLSYAHSDIPVEMMIYTQTSPRVPELVKLIDAAAAQTGQGKEMPITVDASEGFTWPWAWYLRDYTKVGYPDLSRSPSDAQGSVLLLSGNNLAQMDPFLSKYDAGQRYPHRWWFPEDYRNLTLESFAGSLFSLSAWRERWDYFYNRKLSSALGASEALAYFPKGSAVGSAPATGESPGGSGQPPAPPLLAAQPLQAAQLLAGRGTISDGSLQTPKGIAVDGAGNVFVVDSRANKIVKFDATGQLAAQIGRLGTGEGEFTEPWGIAVDKTGNVYVADTWNHRIQKFDGQLRFVRRWGSYGNVTGAALASQNPVNFFGPRDIAIDADGNLWVTDTGNKRIQKFTPDGAPLGAFGGPGRGQGQFQEPVGIAVMSTGSILVADTWNRRVQRFTREFGFEREFSVSGWAGQSVVNKPYIAADGQGNIVVTDPESHRLLRYNASGAPQSVFGRIGSDATSLNGPAAVTFDAQGRLYITDANNSRVVRLPNFEP